MRLSCRQDDPGYERYIALFVDNNIKCFVDGVEVKAITADDEEGWALVYVCDAHGNSLVTPDRTELVTERRTGVVRIQVDPRAPEKVS